jgi:uncharacterized membrane protein YdcZ (DUF606 family)
MPALPARPRFALDSLGACLSGICLVHCIAMPFILAFAPAFAHLLPADESIHRGLALLVVCAGLPSFVSGYRRHKKKRAILGGMLGMAVILASLMLGDRLGSHATEVGVTSLGSVMLCTAHLINRTFCRRCAHCEHGS